MKGQVDYKLPKKMKKRRQLDALVDTVKLPRSRKNSTSAQELLDCHSDSSEIDEFTLPAVSSKRKNRCCVCQSVAARIGLFMISMACLTTCVGLIWVQWHIRHELNSLRKQVTSVGGTNKGESDGILKLQGQLASVNKTVGTLKTGPGSLQEISDTITSIKDKLKSLEDDTKGLQSSIASSQDIVTLPGRVDTLMKTVASMGSDIQVVKSTQANKFEDIEKRLTALEAAATSQESSMTSEQPDTSLDKQFGQMLAQQLQDYKGNMTTGFKNVQDVMDQFSTRLSTLEEFTKSQPAGVQSSVNREEIVSIVNNAVEEKMANMTTESGAVPQYDPKLSDLSTQVNTILEEVEKMQNQGDFVEKGDFLAFKELTMVNFEHINQTLLTLDGEFETVAHRLKVIESAVTNVSLTVDKVKGDGQLAAALQDIFSTAAPSTEPTESPRKRGLSIEGINTKEDLHNAFLNQWPTENGKINLHVLNGMLGDEELSPKAMKQFDTDDDNLYSEEEMANALGLDNNPR